MNGPMSKRMTLDRYHLPSKRIFGGLSRQVGFHFSIIRSLMF